MTAHPRDRADRPNDGCAVGRAPRGAPDRRGLLRYLRGGHPWVAATPAGRSIVGGIFPGADHLVPYHVVTEGTGWACVLDGSPIPLATGDLVVFPHGDPHVLSSA